MRDSETNVLTDNPVFSGICVSCNHAPNCLHRINVNQTLWFCEMFESDIPVILQQKDKLVNPDFEAKQAPQYTGLCMNCDKRESCTLPKPESGIWHCEEYA